MQVPDQAQPAFDDAAKVRQENERARNATPRPMRRSCCRVRKADAARQIEDAKTYSEKTVAQAQAEAERFKQVYAEYQKRLR